MFLKKFTQVQSPYQSHSVERGKSHTTPELRAFLKTHVYSFSGEFNATNIESIITMKSNFIGTPKISDEKCKVIEKESFLSNSLIYVST